MASLVKNRRRLYLALFALTARFWIDEVTAAVHDVRDLVERVDKLETDLSIERNYGEGQEDRAREAEARLARQDDPADVDGGAPIFNARDAL